jgi:hypothetical protein
LFLFQAGRFPCSEGDYTPRRIKNARENLHKFRPSASFSPAALAFISRHVILSLVFFLPGGYMENQQRKINVEYALMQSAYWMAYCMVLTFAAVFLQARGYSGTDIGVILAASNIMALVLQPLVADLADRSKKISVVHILWAPVR